MQHLGSGSNFNFVSLVARRPSGADLYNNICNIKNHAKIPLFAKFSRKPNYQSFPWSCFPSFFEICMMMTSIFSHYDRHCSVPSWASLNNPKLLLSWKKQGAILYSARIFIFSVCLLSDKWRTVCVRSWAERRRTRTWISRATFLAYEVAMILYIRCVFLMLNIGKDIICIILLDDVMKWCRY